MASWIYDAKFLMGMQSLFGMLPFMAGEDNDLKHLTQEQEERRTTTIGFEFPRGLKNLATMFQATVRQLVAIDLINNPV
jgi:hypothetical protein